MTPLAHLDAMDSLRLEANAGLYEPFETAWLKQHLKPGQTFIDVGAHIGYYTTMAAAIVGPRGAVYAFEPEPENFRLLGLNLEAAGAGNVTAYNFAVSDREGTAGLYRSGRNTGDHQLYQAGRKRAIQVNVMRLDDLRLERPADFLKIDVQGLELHVLRGAAGLIGRAPSLKGIVECSPKHQRLAGTDPREMLAAVAALGFKIYIGYRGELIPAPIEEIPGWAFHANLLISREALL